MGAIRENGGLRELHRRAAALPWLYLAILAGISFFICRETFYTESTGHWGSMHGEWIALARIVGIDWLGPRWWPYWGCGAPAQFAYAPLAPFTMAVISRLTAITPAMALHVVTGLVFCMGPLLLYIAAWRLTRAPGYSFFAALAYLAAFPAEHLDPSSGFGLAWFVTTRRAYRLLEWDDLPHLLCLAIVPLAVWALARALEKRRPWCEAFAAALFAAMMTASMFGVVLTAIVASTVPAAVAGFRFTRAMLRSALIALAGYALASPWTNPSLIKTVRSVALMDGEMDWSSRGFLALGILALAGVGVWWLSSRFIHEWPQRWMALFACPSVLIPGLDHYAHIHFLPQPQRYLPELEMALCLIIVFGARSVFRRIPERTRGFVVAAALILAVGQIAALRQFVAKMTAPMNVASSIEYRSAKWFESAFPEGRVLAVGSMATWLNAYANVQQMGGQSYSTAPSRMQQIANWSIMTGEAMGAREAELTLLWMKAYGVQAVAVPGPRSPEAWKPFHNPSKFEGVLPVLWREDDTTIYRVPQSSSSLAHVMRRERVVHLPPHNGLDTKEIASYVDALDHPVASASFEWRGPNEALIHARVLPGDALSVQVTYDKGWHAFVNGVPRKILYDGLQLMVIDPACSGDCDVRLVYDGGWEAKLCRAACLATLLLFAARIIYAGRRRQKRSKL